MVIKGLSPSLPERGKIKIGKKGRVVKSRDKGTEFQLPEKLDHFLITGLERDSDGNFTKDKEAHKLLGEQPKSIPVRLAYDDPVLNFPTRRACYRGRDLWCSGDGEVAQRMQDDGKRLEMECPCELGASDYTGKTPCKMNGSLSVLIDGLGGVGGVWRFRTTSYNTIVGLLSSMAFLRTITGGPLADVPLNLTVQPKQVTTPQGKTQTIYRVSLEYAGEMQALREAGHTIALQRTTTHVSIDNIEAEARHALAFMPSDAPLPGDDNADVTDEFYPEQAAEAEGAVPDRPKAEDYKEDETPAEGSAEKGPEAPDDDEPDSDYIFTDDVGEVTEGLRATEFAQKVGEEFDRVGKAKGDLKTLGENNSTMIKLLAERNEEDLYNFCVDVYKTFTKPPKDAKGGTAPSEPTEPNEEIQQASPDDNKGAENEEKTANDAPSDEKAATYPFKDQHGTPKRGPRLQAAKWVETYRKAVAEMEFDVVLDSFVDHNAEALTAVKEAGVDLKDLVKELTVKRAELLNP